MEPLRIYLFGGFLLERGGVALPPIASRAGRSLFAYLVTHRGRPQQRDLLAGSFWPDMPEGRARRRLSHTLWQIQDVVSDGQLSHLAVTADTLAFDTAARYWLDIEEFDRSFKNADQARRSPGSTMAEAAALRSCVDLYRGDFLAGFFDDWVIADQDHYRQRYLTALSRLVDMTKAGGAYEEALTYARSLTHHDPLSESAHQEVMRICFLLGRTSEAVQQYERCRSMLAEELGAEPSSSTNELYEKVLRQRRAGIRPTPGDGRTVLLGSRADTPFVGRDEERRGLVDHLERVLAGPGGVVLVEGEPGVGKTRLALEAAEDAEWRGFEVSWGRCSPGALRPFAPLTEVLESLSPLRAEQLAEQVPQVFLREALRLAPELSDRVQAGSPASPLRPAEESTRMKEALVHTLGALGRIAPHLIIIDDVQWADEDTLGVLTQMGPRLASSRIMLLLLYRSEEARGDPAVWDVLRDLDRSVGLGRVVLAPLSVFELGDMVKRTLGLTRLDPSLASKLHRRTGGNVLFAVETLLALRDQGLFELGDDPSVALESHFSGEGMTVAPRVRSVIDSRMSLLGATVSEVCEVAAVCGDPSALDVLAGATDLPRRAVLDALDELLHRGLIRDQGGGQFRMAHDQVRQVVYERIEPQRRAALHRRVAETLASTLPDEVESIGHHYREAGAHDQAASFLFRAGLRAEGLHAYSTARLHLLAARAAMVDAGWADANQYEVLAHLEGVLSILGRRGEQAEVLASMTLLVDSSDVRTGDLERRRSWLRSHTGDFHGAEESARLSVSIEEASGDLSALSASLVALGTCVRWSGRPLEAVPHLEAAVAAAASDDRRRAVALTELSSTLIEVQRSAEAMPRLEEAMTIFRDLGDVRGEAEVSGIEARALRQQGESMRAAVRYQEAIELCRRIGYRHGEGVNLVNLGNLHNLMGQVGEAIAAYDQAALVFAELGNTRGEAMVLANAASARHNLLGDDERAHADAVRARRRFADIGDPAGEAQCFEILAGIAARRGGTDEARLLLMDSLDSLAGSGDRFLEGQHLRSLATLLLESGESRAALETLDRADRLSKEAGLDHLAVELMSIRAAALSAEGRRAEAVAMARDAVHRLIPGVERPYLIHFRHAVAALAADEGVEAREATLEAARALEKALAGLSDEDRELAVRRVPEYRAIVEAAEALSPRRIQVRLPAVGAPTGRTLGDEDVLRVTWTIDHPDDDHAGSAIERRRHILLRLLTEAHLAGAVPSIEHLAEALGVSDSTVRRDLEALRKVGHEARTRGRDLQVS